MPGHLPTAELLLVELAGGLLGAWAALWDPLERLLIGRQAMDQAVRSRALRAFHEQGLHRTTEGTGVLIFASLLEHEAVVLGDHGIHARMGDEGWGQAVGALVAGLRRGAPADGFVEAIGRCGAQLARPTSRPAPAAVAQRNELPDALRVSAAERPGAVTSSRPSTSRARRVTQAGTSSSWWVTSTRPVPSAAAAGQRPVEGPAGARVEAGEGLVEQQHLGARRQGAGQQEEAQLAVGAGHDVAAGQPPEAQGGDGGLGAAPLARRSRGRSRPTVPSKPERTRERPLAGEAVARLELR